MFKNYFKSAWRHLRKDRQFSILNLAGLSLGLACVFLIYLWVSDEWNVDKFHKNGDRLYHVMQNYPTADGVMTIVHTPDLLAKSMAEELPGIEQAVVVSPPDEDEPLQGILSEKENGAGANGSNNMGSSIKASEMYVTHNFFDVFSFPLLVGNKDQVLSGKYNVLLSDALAMKLFHTTENLIGRQVVWNRGTGDEGVMNGTYVVSGIFKASPVNSSMQFDLLFPNDLYFAQQVTAGVVGWQSSSPSTYLLLKPGVDPKQFDARCRNFIRDKFKGNPDQQKSAGTLFIQRFADQYLHSRYEDGKIAGGRIEYVKLFSLIACINFMNLSTAKASDRMKEVGVRKCIGASRRSLILQYLGESMMMASLSLVFAALLVWGSLPAFRQITGKDLALHFEFGILIVALGVTILTGLIAGSYPALYLSGFRPVKVLKGQLQTSTGESWARKGLVVFQFSLSIVLIVSVLVVYKQMTLIQTRNLGYSKDQLIHFSNDGNLPQNLTAFLSEARNLPGVAAASDMEGDMIGTHSSGGGISWPGKTDRIEFDGMYVDGNFIATMGLKLATGRPFSGNEHLDSSEVLFNETAIAMMKLKDPLGKTVTLWGKTAAIVGVLKDFNYESLYKKVGPFFLRYRKGAENVIVKIHAGAEKQTLAWLGALYQKYNPGLPFEYRFLDEDFRALYASEQRVAVLSRYFAGIAILLSCLGLYGLAAFTAQKRRKEIGIRKVVGASAGNIALLLSTDFLKWVSLSVGIAFPVAWWALNHWLDGFAYRIQIGVGVFVVAGVSVLGITLATISFQAIKAALANPVKALRSE